MFCILIVTVKRQICSLIVIYLRHCWILLSILSSWSWSWIVTCVCPWSEFYRTAWDLSFPYFRMTWRGIHLTGLSTFWWMFSQTLFAAIVFEGSDVFQSQLLPEELSYSLRMNGKRRLWDRPIAQRLNSVVQRSMSFLISFGYGTVLSLENLWTFVVQVPMSRQPLKPLETWRIVCWMS